MSSPDLPFDAWPESMLGALREWMPRQRWFAGKARQIRRVVIPKAVPIGPAYLAEALVTFEDRGAPERYLLPVASGEAESIPVHAIIHKPAGGPRYYDAVHDPQFRQALFDLLGWNRAPVPFTTQRAKFFEQLYPHATLPKSRVLPVEQSNASLVYGDRLFVKLYRRCAPGRNPDAEMTRYLSEAAGFRNVPAFGGEIQWDGASLALATELRPNEGDAWARAQRAFQQWIENEATLESWLRSVCLLGRRTGQMHLALANTKFHRGEWAKFDAGFMSRDRIRRLRRLRDRAEKLSLTLLRQHDMSGLQLDTGGVEQALSVIEDDAEYPVRRTHGDYHLGQVLCADGDFLIIDFEGEPSRTLAERRAKQPPIRDVAGMLRSFHYAAHAARGTATLEHAETWAEACQRAFLEGWRETVQGTPVADERLLRYYVVEKALYEVAYELNNRPDWLHIPLRALQAELPG